MGSYSVGQAIVKLHVAGIRAQRGYPGSLMPQLTGAVAAVNVYKEEPQKTTLVAEVCAPMSMGVYACEDLAAKVVQAWTEAGGVCSFGSSRFDGKRGIYHMPVVGVWETVAEDTTEETAGDPTEEMV